METMNLQQQLFDVIKKRVVENVPAAEEVAKILDISTDSAYRRIRGEKNISLDELNKLCNHYRISLDQLMSIQTGGFIFQGQLTEGNRFKFEAYLTGMMHNIAYYNSCKEKEIYYMCKDFPIFHYFQFREIAAFKYFFWMKTLLHVPDFRDRKFSFDEYPDELFAIGQKILAIYNQIPSYEIWNAESINNMLRQVEYYRDSQVFESDKDAFILYETFENLIIHMEKQAAAGYKFNREDPQKKLMASFRMYFNEVLIGDNDLLIIVDGEKMSLINHNIFNYMMTRDATFNDNMYNHVQNLMKKSTMISSESEKERGKFFRLLKEKIAKRKKALRV
jgi:transcriptional regulator with XRE-family HTH domain